MLSNFISHGESLSQRYWIIVTHTILENTSRRLISSLNGDTLLLRFPFFPELFVVLLILPDQTEGIEDRSSGMKNGRESSARGGKWKKEGNVSLLPFDPLFQAGSPYPRSFLPWLWNFHLRTSSESLTGSLFIARFSFLLSVISLFPISYFVSFFVVFSSFVWLVSSGVFRRSVEVLSQTGTEKRLGSNRGNDGGWFRLSGDSVCFLWGFRLAEVESNSGLLSRKYSSNRECSNVHTSKRERTSLERFS